MKVSTKFVKPLTDEQRKQLKESMKAQATERRRMRAHAVLLSDRRYSINQIAAIYQVARDRVSGWLQWWGEHEFAGLADDPRGGRPKLLNEAERQQAIELVKAEPRNIKCGIQKIATKLGKVISAETLKSSLRAADYVWQRVRHSLRRPRVPKRSLDSQKRSF